jgi:hypothetical protein
MKYMLMLFGNDQVFRTRAPDETARVVARHTAVLEELRDAGKYVGSARLRYRDEAVTIRPGEGDQVVVDGPFAETKEVLGGFYLIEADSKDEAMAWAKKLPLDEHGAIEVRPARTGAQWRGPVQGKQRYMVMLVASEQTLVSQTRDTIFESIDRHYELSLELAARGRFVGSRSLGGGGEASLLRSRDGLPVVSDGPFAETKELVVGYFVVACDSKQEAIEVGRELLFGLDAVEVRPVWEV